MARSAMITREGGLDFDALIGSVQDLAMIGARVGYMKGNEVKK